MCPVCLATAALVAGKVTSAGGLAAIVLKKIVTKTKAKENPNGK